MLVAAPFVADDFAAFDADERGDVAEFAQTLCDFLGDELAVGEDLEVAVRVRREQVEQLGVHEGLAAEDAEEGVPVGLGVVDGGVERIEVNGDALGGDIHPAALAAQVAGVQDGEVEKRREELAVLNPLFEELDGADAFVTEVPKKFPEAPRVGGL